MFVWQQGAALGADWWASGPVGGWVGGWAGGRARVGWRSKRLAGREAAIKQATNPQ